MDRGTLERRLQRLAGFEDPRVAFEQYPTPADLAAHLVHLAALQGDLSRPVVDLGSGTGVLAWGAALAGAPSVVGVERDPAAVATARENATRLDVPADRRPAWVLGDASRPPLALAGTTVLSNPPFGARRGNEHADRAFLEAASDAVVSYTLHNAGSREFVEAFATDRGATVTHAFAAAFDVDRQFEFHTDDRRTLDTELFRIEW
jgi:putative methylase